MRPFIIFVILFISSVNLFSQNAVLHGKVVDNNNRPLEFANITIVGKTIGTSSANDGSFEFQIPANEAITIGVSSVGFAVYKQEIILHPNERKYLDIKLQTDSKELGQVVIEDQMVRSTTLSRLDPKVMNVITDASGNFESILKTLPGVSSTNELSSQYSVRGGSFDENLVYVNDIEIYRPFLVRSGQQEGMSFVNSDMVSGILFSAGGFGAVYGDKMSSVLDIKYKKPTEFGAKVWANLMGGSVMLEGATKNNRFTHISGFRYKSTEYVLNTMETEGDYTPKFIDFQTYLTGKITNKIEVGILGNITQNQYNFVPQNRRTKFGTIGKPLELRMYFDGNEHDMFNTYLGAVSFDYDVNNNLELKLITSAFHTNEQETFDIHSYYWINEVSQDFTSDKAGDSVLNVGQGSYLEHARNYLIANVYSVEHKGEFDKGGLKWNWGVKAQREEIEDDLSEWKFVDSAGYSVPVSDSIVQLNYSIKGKNYLLSHRYSAYVQSSYSYNIVSGDVGFSIGLRGTYWDFSNEFVLSPRANISYKPYWEKDILFRFSTGLYYQPSFYKEIRLLTTHNYGLTEVSLNKDIKSQKSIHFVLGSDYNFTKWGNPFKLVTEVYYKVLNDLIPYSMDNVRVMYQGYNNSDGYAAGIDMKLNGEFVPGVESWFSLSVMQTQENLRNDGEYTTDANGNTVFNEPGFTPRPTDQRVNVGVFFQDYLPMNPKYKMNIQINFGSGLPFGFPLSPSYSSKNRMKPYQRVDLGFSRILKSVDKKYPKGHILHYVEQSWLSVEIFNMFNRRNTMSYEWVSDYSGAMYAVENGLTGRRFNLKFMVEL